MKSHCCVILTILFTLIKISNVYCWTDEDLELFDLVESTDRKFYDILGVDQKAPASEIRKAYRKLSQQYHPDRNKEPDAEEKFRKIAAIADVLRNEEQRKKYDIILQTGLPDWREPIYYYRRVRNMGLLELIVFLFCLATFGQYLFAWSAYWEKKYEIEEVVLSKLRKKAKQQKKGRSAKGVDDVDSAALEIDLPKPQLQDLFPVQLLYFTIHMIKSTPSNFRFAVESLHYRFKRNPIEVEEIDNEPQVAKIKVRKHVKPLYPDFSESHDNEINGTGNGEKQNGFINQNGKVHSTQRNEVDIFEFKKAMKKFPNGTLQRWEKISAHLNCPVSEVINLAKQMKSHQFSKSVPIAMQGLTGNETTAENLKQQVNGGISVAEANDDSEHDLQVNGITNSIANPMKDKTWTQDEQRALELALQKYPKTAPARWDRIAEFIQSRTKEECIQRYKELAQQIKKKKDQSH